MNALRAALLAMSFLAPVSAAVAQGTNPLADREDKIIPAVLLWMQQTGVKVTYLGNTGGLRGYLAESATGVMQTVYVTPDGLHAVSGLLYGGNFSEQGSNITGSQLDAMRKRYDAVANAVSSVNVNDHSTVAEALKQINVPKPEFDLPKASMTDGNAAILNKLRAEGYELTELGQEGGLAGYFAKKNGIGQSIYVTPDGEHMVVGILIQRGGAMITGIQVGEMRARFESAENSAATPPPAATAAAKPESEVAAEPPVSSGAVSDAAPVSNPSTPTEHPPAVQPPAPAPVNLPAAQGPISGAEGNPSSMYYSDLNEAAFLQAVDTASWFDVGSQAAPTTLYMVADPNCPFCHKTWDYIRPFITNRQVRVRIIMIAFLPGSDEKAREIMASPKPGIRFMESDAGANLGQNRVDPASPQYQAITEHLMNNRKFTETFKITGTPFLAYKDRQGQFYLSKGIPESLDAFFHAAELKK